MNLRTIFTILAVLTVVAVAAPNGNGVYQTQLKFKVLGRDLKDKHTILALDPYVKIYYTQNDKDEEIELGQTDILSDTTDPEWSNVFTFDFDRSKHQKWHFQVLDDDRLRSKDKEGDAWVKVNDYVDAEENLQVNLSKQGYLIIKRA